MRYLFLKKKGPPARNLVHVKTLFFSPLNPSPLQTLSSSRRPFRLSGDVPFLRSFCIFKKWDFKKCNWITSHTKKIQNFSKTIIFRTKPQKGILLISFLIQSIILMFWLIMTLKKHRSSSRDWVGYWDLPYIIQTRTGYF